MKSFILLILLAFALSNRIINDRVANYLKKVAPFKIAEPSKNKFKDWTMEEIREMLGLIREPSHYKPIIPYSNDEYDFRKEHPECMIGIRDQMSCGSCWAFAEITTLQERFCLKSNGQINLFLSAQDPVSCDKTNMGCDGGFASFGWRYLEKFGVVDEDCFPYTSGEGDVEQCIKRCKNGAEWVKYYAKDTQQFYSIEEIKEAIRTNGPVDCGFDVYSDFMNYEGGIYEHVWGENEGGHAVVMVGYGTEGTTNYWICQNSWNEDWGESGYFRIKMGECLIETEVMAGLPVL